jgi:hypothetical protein
MLNWTTLTSDMQRTTTFLLTACIAFLIGCGVGASGQDKKYDELQRLVAVSWGDGKYGPAFYGAHVYLVPLSSGYSVRARVHVGRGGNYVHDCGELGKVQTDAEAVAQWGNIVWREDGLHIGTGTNPYFLPRSKMESGR